MGQWQPPQWSLCRREAAVLRECLLVWFYPGWMFMLDHGVLKSVAEQVMSGAEVVVEGRASRVMRTGSRRFRTVRFAIGGREHQAIEQNPEKPSRWGKLAREGHRVVQFRDLASGKYVAVVVDAEVTEYGR